MERVRYALSFGENTPSELYFDNYEKLKKAYEDFQNQTKLATFEVHEVLDEYGMVVKREDKPIILQ